MVCWASLWIYWAAHSHKRSLHCTTGIHKMRPKSGWTIYSISHKICTQCYWVLYDDVIKWKHSPRYWPFVCGIHWPPVNSPHKASGAEHWCLFALRLNKRLSKQSRGWRSETPSSSLWRNCNGIVVIILLVLTGYVFPDECIHII